MPEVAGTLFRGSTGSEVAALQRAIGARADGIYGPKTERAVFDFQESHGLGVDGVAGPQTWQALLRPDNALEADSSRLEFAALQRSLGIEPQGTFGPMARAAILASGREKGIATYGSVSTRTSPATNAGGTSSSSSIVQWRGDVAEGFSLDDGAAGSEIANGAAKAPSMNAPTWLPDHDAARASFSWAASVDESGATLLGPGNVLGPRSGAPVIATAQRLLGIEPTGTFGTATRRATVAFQRQHGLVADGIIGPRTWAALTTGSTSAVFDVVDPRRFVAARFSFSDGAARSEILNGAARPHLVDALAWLAEHGAPRATIVAVAGFNEAVAAARERAGGFGAALVPTYGERELPALLHAISRDPYVYEVGLGGDYKRFAAEVSGKAMFADGDRNNVYIAVNVPYGTTLSEQRGRIVPKHPRDQPRKPRQDGRLPPGFPHRDAILEAAAEYGLDPVLLAAVGEQESNMGATLNGGHRGDGDASVPLGHGYGIWQLDDRRRPGMAGRPAALLSAVASDPFTAAKVAAAMLHDNLQARDGNVREALAMYNAGSPYALGTAREWPDGRLYYADSVLRYYHSIANGLLA